MNTAKNAKNKVSKTQLQKHAIQKNNQGKYHNAHRKSPVTVIGAEREMARLNGASRTRSSGEEFRENKLERENLRN